MERLTEIDNTNNDFLEMLLLYNYDKEIDYDYEIDYDNEFDYDNDTFENLFNYIFNTNNDNNVVADNDSLKLDKDGSGDYYNTGTRQSYTLDLTVLPEVENGVIEWVEKLNGQSVLIETSVDKGGTWQQPINGGDITNLDSSTTTLDIRQTLYTSDPSVSPSLEYLEIRINEIRVFFRGKQMSK